MDEASISAFATAIGSAAWHWNLAAFCDALEWRNDDYAEEKFVRFQQLAAELSHFDAKTLALIVQRYHEPKAAGV